MQENIEEYLNNLPDDRKTAFENLRNVIIKNLSIGFQEAIAYKMIGHVVPHSIYPKGYHCDTKLPLTYICIANQKNCISVHCLALYFDKRVVDWFVSEYPKHTKNKLDMGKGCVRFKKFNEIPLELMGQLAAKFSVEKYIEIYEKNLIK